MKTPSLLFDAPPAPPPLPLIDIGAVHLELTLAAACATKPSLRLPVPAPPVPVRLIAPSFEVIKVFKSLSRIPRLEFVPAPLLPVKVTVLALPPVPVDETTAAADKRMP